MQLRGLNEARLLEALASAAPPFDAATERELIALAYGHTSTRVNTAALKLVTRHVADAAAIKAAFKGRLAGKHGGLVDAALRRLERPDRGQIAAALVHYEVNATAIAFEEDGEFLRKLLPELVNEADRELFLTNWVRTATSHYVIHLQVMPDALFDALPALHARQPFNRLVIWATRLSTLPARFAELAPYLKHLVLGFNQFTELPDAVFACDQLESLVIDDPHLARLGDRLPELTKLKSLRISRSKVMRTLPPEVCACSSLEELHLGSLKLTRLPAELVRLTRLTKLAFTSTPIAKPDAALAALSLSHVNVRWSKTSVATARALWPQAEVES